jgi:hypothetical protein
MLLLFTLWLSCSLNWLFLCGRGILFESFLEELDDGDMVVNFCDFVLVHGLEVGGFVLEPAQIISHEMDALAAVALDQHNPLMVCMLGEGTDGLGVTLIASETQHV